MKQWPFLLLGILSLCSCKKYLATKPQDFLAPETYYNTEADLTAALMSVYDELGDKDEGTYSRNLIVELALPTDEAYMRTTTNSAAAPSLFYTADASMTQFQTCWSNLYVGINRANLLLENIDKAAVSDSVKSVIRGEALFLRAYYHFVLVSYWGDVPLKLHSTQSAEDVVTPRSPSAAVYAQVIEDMTQAETLVRDVAAIGFSGRISKTAVEGVLARVCLFAAGRLKQPAYYKEARDWAWKVIQSGEHTLNSSYAQIFINQAQDIYDIGESMWEVEFYGNGIGTSYFEAERFGAVIGIRNDNEILYNMGWLIATGTLYNLYDTADLRRDRCLSTFYYSGNNTATHVSYPATLKWGRYPAKWRREEELQSPLAKNYGSVNFPLLRYADVLLMFAEADNEWNGAPTQEAYDAVNQVRRRAYGKSLNTADAVADVPTGLTYSQFAAFIKNERARELAFEGIRKLDLLRWGTFISTMKSMVDSINLNAPTSSSYSYSGNATALLPYQNVSDRDTLFPIPTLEMSVNTAITNNNPGW
ncbi:MAG: RagB/SusD family nutrient uptake outer membrane protein [Niabella sp.]